MMAALSRFLFGTLRGRLIIGVAAVHAVMMALFVADLTARQRVMLLERQIEAATALSQTLATSAAGWIAADDLAGLQELVEAQRHYPEVLFIMLADNEGRVLASIDKARRGLYLLDLPRETSQTVLASTPTLVDMAAPAMVQGRHVGWVRVGIGQKAASAKLTEIVKNGVFYALAAIVIGSLIAWRMGRRITRRLYAVQETINAVRAGNHLARSPIAGSDEPAVMAQEFNSMLDALAKRDVALRANEERYRALIHKVQVSIVLHDGQGRLLTSNPLAEELLGLSADQLLGKFLIDPDWHFLREDGSVLPVAEYPVSLVLASHQPLKGQVMGINRPDRDEVTWVLVSAEPEYDQAGEISQVIVSFVDISERKRADEKLRHLNRELRAISNCNQVLVRAEDKSTLLNDICRIICDEADYSLAWVGYAEHDAARTVRPVAWAGADDGYLENANITWADTERGRGPIGTAIRSGESVCFQDFAIDPKAAPWRESALQRGYRSSLALPLRDEHETTFGALNIYSTEPNTFTPDEVRLLEELAGDLAFGIMVLRGRLERQRAEEALYEAQQTFRALIENSPDIIARYDHDCRRTYVNPAYLKTAQIPQQELLASAPMQRSPLPAASAEILQNLLRRVLDSGIAEAVDVNWPKAETDSWYNIYAFPELDRGGRVVSVMTISRDITERKQTEEEIRQLNDRYSLATNAARLGVWDWDIQKNELVWDDRMYALYGIKREDFAGAYEAWLQGIHPDDRTPSDEISRLARLGEREYDTEFRVVWPDGSVHYLKAYGQIVRDTAGNALRMTGVNFDITERRLAEVSLRESEAKLKEAQRIAHLGHWELKLANNTLYWSDEVYRIFGLEPQEFIASYEAFLEHVHPEDRELVNTAYNESLNNKTGYDIVHRIALRNGAIKYVNERCVTEYDAKGTPLRSLGTVLDITERKQAEDALTLLNQKLDVRVQQRTAELEERNEELERMNRLFVGRELRMVELKERIKELENESRE